MAIVKPGKGRAVIENDRVGLRITIPARTQSFATLFLGVWLIGWAVGEIMVSRQLFGDGFARQPSGAGAVFTAAWLVAWTLGGAWVIHILLWQLTGKEIIELTSTSLRQRKQIPIFSRRREYAVASIRSLRLAPPAPTFYQGQYMIEGLTFKNGAISFDYGRSTHHLAAGLDEADADYVIGEMCKRVKSLCAKAETRGEP